MGCSPSTSASFLQHGPCKRADHGKCAPDGRSHARSSWLHTVAVWPCIRPPLRRRSHRLASGAPLGRAFRAAEGDADYRNAARLLAARIGLRRSWRFWSSARHNRPVSATFRLEQIEADRVARTLSAWSITSNLTTATLTASWELLASMTSPRIAIADLDLTRRGDQPRGRFATTKSTRQLRISATKWRVFPQGLCHSRLPPCATGFPTVQDIWSHSQADCDL